METQIAIGLRQRRALSMTTRLRQAIGLLRLDNQQLSEHLRQLAAANPHVSLTAAPRPVQTPNWLDQFLAAPPPADAAKPAAAAPGGGLSPSDAAERVMAPPPGLIEHLRAQIGLLVRAPADRPLAEAFLAALEPSGWLGASVEDIARHSGRPLADAERVLAALQQAEPAGLFARSLAECLRLQAQDQGLLTPDFNCLLGHLPLLAKGAMAELATLCEATPERLAEMLRALRAMNPKPGASFDAAPMPIREPDLIVRRQGKDWTVELNRSTLPVITLGESPETGNDPLWREAQWIVGAVARRNATTLRIAREMLVHQAGFLEKGAQAMLPLSAADVARATGLHLSTISRVTAGLMVATPGPTLPLRAFFSAALPAREGGEGIATARLLHEMQALIATEDPAAPLGDADIARHFEAEGVIVARRTVAKYRGLLGIAAASARRKR
ncbi:RNA polymerase sigma-54 factor [Phaeovulum sp.]|uniref:RNA polymerase factor sigma-54 n=1 Tax=Phaeovulum sp. TaxID=2934796 RepID=UPI0035684CEE